MSLRNKMKDDLLASLYENINIDFLYRRELQVKGGISNIVLSNDFRIDLIDRYRELMEAHIFWFDYPTTDFELEIMSLADEIADEIYGRLITEKIRSTKESKKNENKS